MSFLNRFLDGKPQDDTLQSVVRNLVHLLNSKTRYGSPLCSFGLGDYFAQAGAQAVAEAVMREVLTDIRTYEPRLRAIAIKVLGDGQLPLAFELIGELRSERGRPLTPKYELMPCRLSILFDPFHGEVVVHSLEDSRVR